jgi:tight adherence protein B
MKRPNYLKNLDGKYLDAFIDFLNQINSNLCIGMGFESAVIASSKMLQNDLNDSSKAIIKLSHSIQMGVRGELLYQSVCDVFPIYEATLFSRMMQLSKQTGSNPSIITGITIDKLYMKHKVNNEIEMVLYQKKLEQTILCLAPMFIVLFIRLSSPGYMDLLYQTAIGRVVMTFALSLIIAMKLISEHIIKFKI